MKIISDLKHKAFCYYGTVDWKSCLLAVVTDGTTANLLYRIASWFKKFKLGIVSLVLVELNKYMNGCVIGSNAAFDDGFVLMHPIGVVINGAVKGGKNVVVESSVVIGVARFGNPVKAPVIGNNVFIGAGAKLLGDIKIGDNAKIGANAVIITDVPEGATFVGVPAYEVKRESKKKSLT